VRKKYQGKDRKSNRKFEVVQGQELLVRVPLPMAEVWAEMQAQVEELTWQTGLQILRAILEGCRECPIARRPPGVIYHRDKQSNAFWLRATTIIVRVFCPYCAAEAHGEGVQYELIDRVNTLSCARDEGGPLEQPTRPQIWKGESRFSVNACRPSSGGPCRARMSDEDGVTPFEVVVNATLTRVTLGSGKGALGTRLS